ncbi:Cytochrome P450 monooxygenase [Colletotrichum fructicola]|uniref:Cytochrome P450 monooxygenase eqxH n=1 Tax=Colletotrichum fructicola (strain Nara gc5) TaxID=1213859 RepID=A0A7J6JFI5_COLFN|nr:Cytochrome P450 monooxygenase [Colletotrichum fructicola]KAE9569318.1 Cytochrome P450 monooxygenase [Colletotrichum fructicola]KAF4425485.1 Cytochrome P450 monooxygenase eqxH [Colletotrichum fructicola]KAF4488981.1 Cytochrome P450 monooxygenase eqxH [Colletotrichum fructicola Nara gc5]KAF4883564.1 Cytochrome P450 monooxygenase eqxH [Colletotrichum fructicola]
MEFLQPPKHFLSTWAESPLLRKMDVWTSLCLGIILLSVFAVVPHMRKPSRKLPWINPPESLDLFNSERKKGFLLNARGLMETGRKKFPGQPYRFMTDVGETVVIPPEFVHDIRNDPGLSFMDAFADNFHPQLSGFDGFAVGTRPDQLFQVVIKKSITKLLNQITEPLSSEAKFAVDLRFGTSTEWREFNIKADVLDIISHLSSRVFLGDEVCRNEAWLEVTKSYTVNAFIGAETMRIYPSWLRPLAQWFVPQCKVLRQQVADSRRIIEPVLQKRRDLRAQARANGEPIPRFNDGLDWFEEESRGAKYDAAGAQLGLSAVAIHTTTDLLVETMLRIAEHPELFNAIRKEIVEVLSAEGWKKTALFNMKLTDSVLKEAQRLKPVTSAIMSRVATRPVTLPNGLQLQTGERCVADLGRMIDPTVYENPDQFDGYRFVRMRGTPGLDAQAHLVSTSPEHIGFGHGKHACPGRFFAGNELKIALAHIIMKYDWQLTPGYKHRWEEYGFGWSSDGMAKLLMRRRESPEMDIDNF